VGDAIEIRGHSGTRYGTFVFDEPAQLEARRTGDGFSLVIPGTLVLHFPDRGKPCPMVSNLRCVVSAVDRPGTVTDLGVALDPSHYLGAIPESTSKVRLEWRGPLAAMALYERIRDGRPAMLRFQLTGELCFVLDVNGFTSRFRSEPIWIGGHGTKDVTYKPEAWKKVLDDLGVAQVILLEVPLPASPPTGWDKLWKHVRDAVDSFEQGGTTGWKNCVASLREAMTEWQKVEPENLGNFQPRVTDRNTWTLRQRIDSLRWLVREVAHLGPHKPADEWTRDEALLVLSTLAALIAVRKP
jgi:hypothetical protein